MEVRVTQQEDCKRQLEVEIPQKELEPKFTRAYKKYQPSIALEGFRKGKVPISLIKKLYGQAIEKEVIEEVVQESYKKAVAEKNLKVISPAQIEDVSYEPEKGLTYRTVVEVEPEIELTRYKGLQVEKEIYRVTDKDVEQALERLRDEQSVMIPVEGAAQKGHYLLADFQMVDQSGIPLIGEKYEDRYIHLGDDQNEAPFSEQLLGVKPGEVRRIKLYRRRQDEVTEQWYSVTVKEIKEKKLPELDDELARDVGDFKNLEELRKHVYESLQFQVQSDSSQKFYNRLADEVIKNNPFTVPATMIENYLDAFIESLKKESKEALDEKAIRENYRATAIWNIKWYLIRDKIAQLENITVTDEEIDRYWQEMSQNNDKNELSRALKDKEARKRIKEDLLERKVLQFLAEHAQVTEKVVDHSHRDRIE